MTRRVKASTAPRRGGRVASQPQTRILDAALSEFVELGFAGASTNTIARKAGVAKGLVFHHFGSKADLYMAVLEHVIVRVEVMLEAIPLPTDLFERLHEIVVHKMRWFQHDPLGYRFMLEITNLPPSLRGRVEPRLSTLRSAWPRMFDGVDTARLRPGVTLDQAKETLALLRDGVERRYYARLAELPDRGISALPELVDEVWAHFERVRDGIYVVPAQRRRAPSRSAAASESAR